jgi:hypothetical protein
MKLDANKFHRKSGVAQWRDLRFLPLKLAAIAEQQPDFVQPNSRKQSTTYTVKKQVPPLIWTALKYSRPYGTGPGDGRFSTRHFSP